MRDFLLILFRVLILWLLSIYLSLPLSLCLSPLFFLGGGSIEAAMGMLFDDPSGGQNQGGGA